MQEKIKEFDRILAKYAILRIYIEVLAGYCNDNILNENYNIAYCIKLIHKMYVKLYNRLDKAIIDLADHAIINL